jgi:serine/threonine protein kinase
MACSLKRLRSSFSNRCRFLFDVFLGARTTALYRMCQVLRRCTRRPDDDDSDEDYEDEEDDELLFEWTDKFVTVKVNYMDRMKQLREQEIAALQFLGPNPIHVRAAMDVLFDGQNLNAVMSYCDSGDLCQLLQARQIGNLDPFHGDAPLSGLAEGEARYWFRQVMKGVAYLHSCGICHRDLSPENIMVDQNGGVFIDVGLCLRVPYVDPDRNDARTDIVSAAGRSMRCLIQPRASVGEHWKSSYMSPEVYASLSRQSPFDGAAAEVWTSGTILFYMITGNPSYQRPHMTDPQFDCMTRGLRQLLTYWNVTMSEEGIALLQGMLKIDPRERLTIEEVCNHAWFDYPDEPPVITETDLLS